MPSRNERNKNRKLNNKGKPNKHNREQLAYKDPEPEPEPESEPEDFYDENALCGGCAYCSKSRKWYAMPEVCDKRTQALFDNMDNVASDFVEGWAFKIDIEGTRDTKSSIKVGGGIFAEHAREEFKRPNLRKRANDLRTKVGGGFFSESYLKKVGTLQYMFRDMNGDWRRITIGKDVWDQGTPVIPEMTKMDWLDWLTDNMWAPTRVWPHLRGKIRDY